MMLRLFPNPFSRENKRSTNNWSELVKRAIYPMAMAWFACNVLNPEVSGVGADGDTVVGDKCRFRNLVQRGGIN